MWYLKTNKLFFASLILGPAIWLCVFVFLPVNVVEGLSFKTILFIALNYLSLIIGFMCFNFKDRNNIELKQYYNIRLLKLLIFIVSVSYLIRFIDLFLVRDMSFSQHVFINRELSQRDFELKYIIFALASVLKSLYFFPIIIVLSNTIIKKHWTIIVSYILLFLPLIEAILKGSRKPFFDVVIIFFFSVLIFTKIKLTKRRIFLTLFTGVLLFSITNIVLFDREAKNDKNIYNQILEARYNDFLEPSKSIENYILNENTSDLNKRITLTYLHLGQYFTHGFFELNYIMKIDEMTLNYGSYSFSAFSKLFRNKTTNPSPREYVYITAFGGLYLDFGWFSIILMLLFGIFQKFVFQKAIKSIIWRPVLSYLLIINVFLLVFNYIRGAGIYPFIGFFIILLVLKTSLLSSNEKSTNT